MRKQRLLLIGLMFQKPEFKPTEPEPIEIFSNYERSDVTTPTTDKRKPFRKIGTKKQTRWN